ncbi:MAG: Rare lipoprotein [Gammaproteobacteria bacterium]|jgi:LPS-assembly lipoprotein|nr:Rare lipoprotein [Gammaproteobacteria bacterium]
MSYLLQFNRYGLLWLILSLGLVGCGFKLRGTESVPLKLHQLYLQTHNVESPLRNELITALHTRGVTLVKLPREAPYSLYILNTVLNQAITSTSTDMQVRNYLITYSLQYQLIRNDGQRLFPPQTLSLTRTYVANTTQILNDSYEFSTIRQGLRQDAINQLFERLRVLKLDQIAIDNHAT